MQHILSTQARGMVAGLPRYAGRAVASTAQPSERSWPVFIGVLTLALCLAAAAPDFHSIDEISMYVTAVNLADRGEWHSNQLGWAQFLLRPGEQLGSLSEAGDLYSKKSPIVVVFMALLVKLGRLLPALGPVRATLLLGPIFTALTAAGLYVFARRLGYTRRVGSAVALAFVVATMASVHSRTALGEPVASFGLLLALHSAYRVQAKPAALAPFTCGVGLALASGASAIYFMLVPFFAVVLAMPLVRRGAWLAATRTLMQFGLPVAALAVALASYNYLRFGDILQTGYHFGPGREGFTMPLWLGALALTLSPARGFMWYNPLAWLALVGWPHLHRKQPALSWTMLAVVALHVIAYGTWWEWWGGYTWGPRFLVPIVPYVMLASLPIWSAAFDVGSQLRSLTQLAVGGVVALGAMVQIAGMAIDYNLYEAELENKFPVPASQTPRLYKSDPAVVFDIARSPILVHLQRLTTTREFDFAWWPHAATGKAIPSILNRLSAEQRAGDAVIYLAYELLRPLVETSGLPPVYGLPIHIPPDAAARAMFARALHDARRVWLITSYRAGDPANRYEAHLRATWASVAEATLDDYRVILFARPPTGTAIHPAREHFGPIDLIRYAVGVTDEALFVELHWRAGVAPGADYTTFVHVLGPDGTFITGQDRTPLGGYRPTSAWQAGDTLIDRFAFMLEPAQLARVQVEVGWYNWPTIERLPVTDADGKAVPGDALLLEWR